MNMHIRSQYTTLRGLVVRCARIGFAGDDGKTPTCDDSDGYVQGNANRYSINEAIKMVVFR